MIVEIEVELSWTESHSVGGRKGYDDGGGRGGADCGHTPTVVVQEVEVILEIAAVMEVGGRIWGCL